MGFFKFYAIWGNMKIHSSQVSNNDYRLENVCKNQLFNMAKCHGLYKKLTVSSNYQTFALWFVFMQIIMHRQLVLIDISNVSEVCKLVKTER